jgi:hypothetical protein
VSRARLVGSRRFPSLNPLLATSNLILSITYRSDDWVGVGSYKKSREGSGCFHLESIVYYLEGEDNS